MRFLRFPWFLNSPTFFSPFFSTLIISNNNNIVFFYFFVNKKQLFTIITNGGIIRKTCNSKVKWIKPDKTISLCSNINARYPILILLPFPSISFINSLKVGERKWKTRTLLPKIFRKAVPYLQSSMDTVDMKFQPFARETSWKSFPLIKILNNNNTNKPW